MSPSHSSMACPSLFNRPTIRMLIISKRGPRGTRAWDSWPRASRACCTRARTSRPRSSSRQPRCACASIEALARLCDQYGWTTLMMDIWVDFSSVGM